MIYNLQNKYKLYIYLGLITVITELKYILVHISCREANKIKYHFHF